MLFVPSTAWADGNTIIYEPFDPPVSGIHLEGGANLVDKKQQGYVLSLPNHAHAVLPLTTPLSGQGMTIAFWMQPYWDETDTQSHVFLTSRWKDGKQGYLALSYGWWEPLGEKRLYFIVNNQQAIHCSASYRFERNSWVLLVASWHSGKNGQCKIYVDDVKLAESDVPFNGNYNSTGPLYLGSDLGATEQRHRRAGFSLDELHVFDHSFTDSAVRALYYSTQAKRYISGHTDWDWMRTALKLNPSERRAKNGTLLETRVIFDEDIHWAKSRAEADSILERVKAAGFNVYVPCVWHGRGTYYPSNLTNADERVVKAIENGYDPLRYLIEKAHAMGLEIHPWFTVMRREWRRYPEYYPEGTPRNAYDVHQKNFRTFIVDLMLDVVRRYDVDGINLDYIRAMGICTSKECKEDYRNSTGHGLLADYYLRYVAGSARDRIQAWQDSAVTDIVKGFSTQAKKIRPDIIISVDGHPKAKGDTRPLEGRDELKWVNNGLADVVFAMDYRKRFDDNAINAVRADLVDPRKLYPLFGNYDRIDNRAVSREGELIEKYVEFVRCKWPGSGVAFYIFNMLSDDQIRVLRKKVYFENSLTNWPVVGHKSNSAALSGARAQQ